MSVNGLKVPLDELKKYLILLFFFAVFILFAMRFFPSFTGESLIAFHLSVYVIEVGEFDRVQFLF